MKTKLNQKPNLSETVRDYLDEKVTEEDLRQALQSWKLMDFTSTNQKKGRLLAWTRKWK